VFGDVQDTALYLQICEECGGVETILMVGTSYWVDKGIQRACQDWADVGFGRSREHKEPFLLSLWYQIPR
jgi:hypothetical protein